MGMGAMLQMVGLGIVLAEVAVRTSLRVEEDDERVAVYSRKQDKEWDLDPGAEVERSRLDLGRWVGAVVAED